MAFGNTLRIKPVSVATASMLLKGSNINKQFRIFKDALQDGNQIYKSETPENGVTCISRKNIRDLGIFIGEKARVHMQHEMPCEIIFMGRKTLNITGLKEYWPLMPGEIMEFLGAFYRYATPGYGQEKQNQIVSFINTS